MYKKAALFLLLGNLILVSGSICAAQAGRIQESVVPAAAFSESSTIGVTYDIPVGFFAAHHNL